MALLVVEDPAGTAREAVLEVTPAPHRGQSGDEVEPAVIAAARRGDAQAFETILRHYDRRLRVIADRVLGDRQLLDDALQEVAIKALRGLPSYRGDAPLGAWLCRIATTTCLDYLRRSRPEDLRAPDNMPEPVSGGRDPADRLDARERLAAALAALPTDQRVAVLLIDQFGYDYRTAAEALGVPVGTAASRVAAARARLRAALAVDEEVGR
jgi:RNA polymerase sigma-70 factor, ECF subfamily